MIKMDIKRGERERERDPLTLRLNSRRRPSSDSVFRSGTFQALGLDVLTLLGAFAALLLLLFCPLLLYPPFPPFFLYFAQTIK